jgi:hypothetical protein
MDIIVERIVKRYDILWINAAGNEGASHWSGLTVDRNSDGWIDVSGTSPYLMIRPHTETLSLLVIGARTRCFLSRFRMWTPISFPTKQSVPEGWHP